MCVQNIHQSSSPPSTSTDPEDEADEAGSTHSYSVCSLSHCTMPSVVLSPLNSRGWADLSLRQNLTVGQPWISKPSIQFTEESTFASIMLGLLANILAASSKWGANCLQCPHHGAQNFTKTSLGESRISSLKLFPTTTFTGSSLVSGRGADFKKGSISPLVTLSTKPAKLSAVISSPMYLYFFSSALRQRTEGVDSVFSPKYSDSLSQRPLPSFFEETDRITFGLVESYVVNAERAAASAFSSPRSRNKAGCLFWNIFQTAVLSKGRTSAWSSMKIAARRRISFIVVYIYLFRLKFDLKHAKCHRPPKKPIFHQNTSFSQFYVKIIVLVHYYLQEAASSSKGSIFQDNSSDMSIRSGSFLA